MNNTENKNDVGANDNYNEIGEVRELFLKIRKSFDEVYNLAQVAVKNKWNQSLYKVVSNFKCSALKTFVYRHFGHKST